MTRQRCYRLTGLLILFLFSFSGLSAKTTITTSPQNARIFVNGVLMGTGKVQVSVPKNECLTIEIKLEGYISETRTFCNKKGSKEPPKNEYIQMQTDEVITSSMPVDDANNETRIWVKTTKTREEAWKQVLSIVLSKFDVVESNDEKAGYLRTAWAGTPFKNNTLRVRLIIKQVTDDPLVYIIKLTTEESGKPGTPYNADEQYRPFKRLLKRYDGFIEEMTARLQN